MGAREELAAVDGCLCAALKVAALALGAPVEKADPYGRLVLDLLARLQRKVRGPERSALDAFAAVVAGHLRAGGATPASALAEAAERYLGLTRGIAPGVLPLLRTAGETVAARAKTEAAAQAQRAVAASLDEHDREVTDHLAASSALFVRDQYGARADALSARAREVVAAGVAEGLDRFELVKRLRAELRDTDLRRSDAYYGTVVEVFAARARTYGALRGLEEAGASYYEVSALLDEVSCFAAGTPVRMADGSQRPIEMLQPGDRVLSGRGFSRTVTATRVLPKHNWRRLALVDGRDLVVTDDHRLLTSRGWVAARDVVLSDSLVGYAGSREELRGLWRADPPSSRSRRAVSVLRGTPDGGCCVPVLREDRDYRPRETGPLPADLRDMRYRLRDGTDQVLLSRLLPEEQRRDDTGEACAKRARSVRGVVRARVEDWQVVGRLHRGAALDPRGRRGVLAPSPYGPAQRHPPRWSTGLVRLLRDASAGGRRACGPDLRDRSADPVWPRPRHDLAERSHATRVAAVEVLEGERLAYDIQVDADETFLANDVVAHNCDVCRYMDGKVFGVREALARYDEVAAGPPEGVAELQPWLGVGRGEDGGQVLYFKHGGERRVVADVLDPAAGQVDRRGAFAQRVSDADMQAAGLGPPPYHGRCFVAGTLVDTPLGRRPIETLVVGDVVITGVTRAHEFVEQVHEREVAEVAEVRVGETLLAASVDHPVLTPDGWREMGALQVGDELFGHGLELRVLAADALPSPPQDGPPGREQCGVFAGVNGLLFFGAVPLSGVDLNGDLLFREREVDVEDVEVHLNYRMESGVGERGGKNAFYRRELGFLGPMHRAGATDGRRLSLTARRRVRGLGERLPLFWRAPRLAEAHGLASASDGDTVLAADAVQDHAREPQFFGDALERPAIVHVQALEQRDVHDDLVPCGYVLAPKHRVDECAGHSEVLGHLRTTLSALVPRDDLRVQVLRNSHTRTVTRTRRIRCRTRVYNLAISNDPSFVANGIVAHNCRCLVLYREEAPEDLAPPTPFLPPKAPPEPPLLDVEPPEPGLVLPVARTYDLPGGKTRFSYERQGPGSWAEELERLADKRGVVKLDARALGRVGMLPAGKDPRPYAEAVVRSGRSLAELIAEAPELQTLGTHIRDAGLRATKRTVRQDVLGSYAATSALERPAQVVVVRYRGELYLHDGHETILGNALSGRDVLNERVRLVDLDKYAPPRVDPARWAAACAQSFADLEAGKTGAAAAVRSAVRELVASEGAATRDDRRLVPFYESPFAVNGRASALDVADMAGADGLHRWDASVVVTPQVARDAASVMRRLKHNPEEFAKTRAFAAHPTHGLSTFIHEELHGTSSITSTAYQGAGVGVEEALTEILARKVTRRLLQVNGRVDDPDTAFGLPNLVEVLDADGTTRRAYKGSYRQGAYSEYIGGLLSKVAEHYGHDGVHARVEAAASRTRAWDGGRATWRSAEQQVDAFVDALEGGTPERRAALKAALLAPDSPLRDGP